MRRPSTALLAVLTAALVWTGLPVVAAGAQPRVVSGPFTVTVLPAFPNLPVTIDHQTALTDRHGVARFASVVDVNAVYGRVKVSPKEYQRAGRVMKVSQARIFDRGAVIALDVYYKVRFAFSNPTGGPLDRSGISTLTLKSTTGAIATLPADKPAWLHGTRVVPLAGRLEVKKIGWSVQAVPYRGSNVVNASQQRFTPADTSLVDVALLFHSARLHVYDAFFGFGQGTSIELTYPDGSTRQFRLDGKGTVELPSLPRGNYTVTVLGAGPRSARTVAISRDQSLALKYYSWLDIGLALFVALCLSVGLVAIGYVLRRRRRGNGDRSDKPKRTKAWRPTAPRVRSTSWKGAVGANQRRSHGDRARRGWMSVGPRRVRGVCAVLAVLAACLGLLAVVPAAATPGQARNGTATSPTAVPGAPLVLAHYYIWFTPSSWNRAKIDYPLIGRYASNTERIIRTQIQQAKSAGIGGFIVSWKSNTSMNATLHMVVKIAEQEHFKLAITYEGLDFQHHALPPSRVVADLRTFVTEFAASPVFDVFGKPLVVISGTPEMSPADVRDIAAPFRSRLLVLASEKDVAGYESLAPFVDGDLYYWSSADPQTNHRVAAKLVQMSNAIHAHSGLWIAPAAPGFDARLVGGTKVVPRRDGVTLREEWNAALASVPDAISVISWNEYSENTYVEPSKKYGNTALRVLAALTGMPTPVATDFDSSGPPGVDGPVRATLTIGGFLVAAVGVLVVAAVVRRRTRKRPARHSARSA